MTYKGYIEIFVKVERCDYDFCNRIEERFKEILDDDDIQSYHEDEGVIFIIEGELSYYSFEYYKEALQKLVSEFKEIESIKIEEYVIETYLNRCEEMSIKGVE